MTERFPVTSQERKGSGITDDECRKAMEAGDFEYVSKWYAQQEKLVDEDPTPHGRLQLTVRLARLQFESGAVDPDTGESYAFGTLEAARDDAYQRYDDVAVRQIDALIAEMRGEGGQG